MDKRHQKPVIDFKVSAGTGRSIIISINQDNKELEKLAYEISRHYLEGSLNIYLIGP